MPMSLSVSFLIIYYTQLFIQLGIFELLIFEHHHLSKSSFSLITLIHLLKTHSLGTARSTIHPVSDLPSVACYSFARDKSIGSVLVDAWGGGHGFWSARGAAL